jgi:nitroimidazol reductase NimA-like FMN-containing flavoprotein (pyridoxamine 5'-phosphate oxidase superfamily)
MTTNNVATLVAYDCWSLLEGADVARVAWLGADGIRLVPVNYMVADGGLWFRTDHRSALARECGGQQLVVEVDHVDAGTAEAWSVVVVGTPELIAAADAPDMLGEMRVWASGPHSTFVRVEPVTVTGRRVWKT